MNRKLLIVAAHPDDEVLGCFATVAKMIAMGWEAYTCILGTGAAARGNVTAEIFQMLRNAQQTAGTKIGIIKTYTADFPDNAFDSVPLLQIVKKIEAVKACVQPEVVFTHHRGDINIDHRITYDAVLTATRPMAGETVKDIYAMEVPSSTEWNAYRREDAFIPNLFIDVKDTIDMKIEALKEYRSELREYPHPRSLEYVKSLARLNGAKVGLAFAECFEVVRSIREVIS